MPPHLRFEPGFGTLPPQRVIAILRHRRAQPSQFPGERSDFGSMLRAGGIRSFSPNRTPSSPALANSSPATRKEDAPSTRRTRSTAGNATPIFEPRGRLGRFAADLQVRVQVADVFAIHDGHEVLGENKNRFRNVRR